MARRVCSRYCAISSSLPALRESKAVRISDIMKYLGPEPDRGYLMFGWKVGGAGRSLSEATKISHASEEEGGGGQATVTS
jgi:hypothetical protein